MKMEVDWSLTTLQIIALGFLINYLDLIKSIASRFYFNPLLNGFVLSSFLILFSLGVAYLFIIVGRRVGVFS